jgi:hypothetical protein
MCRVFSQPYSRLQLNIQIVKCVRACVRVCVCTQSCVYVSFCYLFASAAHQEAYIGYNQLAGTLLSKGLSGQIFTQISDIECELSGFFTYDRRVSKVDLDAIGLSNRQLLHNASIVGAHPPPPLPPEGVTRDAKSAAAAAAAAAAANSAACQGELLHNGICLSRQWPPRRNLTSSRTQHGLIEPPLPSYITAPPVVRNISVGRSLFVDAFLIDASLSHGVEREFFAAEYLGGGINPIISSDRPWENDTYARPFSGGVFWHSQTQRYRLYYGCGDTASGPLGDSNLALCLATSVDGLRWEKPLYNVVNGTNIVVNFPLRSNNVWDAGPNAPNQSRRYVIADTNGPKFPSEYYWLWGSPDGIDWTPIKNTTGRTSDRGTFWRDPFRKRWVYSIKGYQHDALAEFGRHRMYWETPDEDAFGNYSWEYTDPVYWAAADTLDQPGVCPGNCRHPELYTLDVSSYESLHVMYYTILRGKGVELKQPGAPKPVQHPEYDAIYLVRSVLYPAQRH